MDTIPDEIMTMIGKAVLRGNTIRDQLNLISIGSLVCSYWNEIWQDGYIWQCVVQSFPDSLRLERRYRATVVSWKELCRERLSSVFLEQEILVGDRTSPEAKYLIQVHGTGVLYIGANRNSFDFIPSWRLHQSSEPEYELVVKRSSDMYYMIPFRAALRDATVVDISAFDPFLLILTSRGNVIEMIFKPSWATKWKEHSQMRFLEFSGPVELDRVYAFAHACFALQDGFVWCWSIIDHPFPLEVEEDRRENIKTPPIRLSQLEKLFVYHLESERDYTRMYYVDRDAHLDLRIRSPTDLNPEDVKFIDVSNVDIMYLISTSIFTESEIEAINQRLADQ
jgi:hypothetical protein